MPLYEYKCEGCGRVFEVRQKFADAPLTQDEKCGGPVHRLLSAPALQFKGSGWYVTDYAKGPGKSKNTSGESNGSSSSSESKPASDTTKTTEPKPSPTTSGSDKK